MSAVAGFRKLFGAPLLSPGWMLAWAVRLGFFDLALELLGLRRYASVLSGTLGPGGQPVSVFLGVFYLVGHFAFVLVAPPLLMGCVLAWACSRLLRADR